MRISVYTALAVMLMSASGAIAQQFVEFHIDVMSSRGGLEDAEQVSATMVVRANDPTQTPIPSSLAFYASKLGEIRATDALDVTVTRFIMGASSISIEVEATLSTGPAVVALDLWDDGPSANENGSVPNNPNNYRGWKRGFANFETPTLESPNVVWSRDEGFGNGVFSLSVRNVPNPDPPQPEGCSVAALAEPYGVHDFSDVVAYLAAFGAGCP